jgi:hypothetical protein
MTSGPSVQSGELRTGDMATNWPSAREVCASGQNGTTGAGGGAKNGHPLPSEAEAK